MKSLALISLALLVILASCVTAPRSLDMQVSPLRMDSPLAVRRTHAVRERVYLPVVRVDATPTPTPMPAPTATPRPTYCERNAPAHMLAELMRTHPGQHRASMRCHPLLVQVAQARANDMYVRKYFGHCDPDSRCPNWHVRQTGYRLPGHYPDNGNSIESISANHRDAAHSWQAFLDSPPHKRHVLGEIGFFREQQCYGVGYADERRRSDPIPFPVIRAYVIITAPCP